MRISAINGSVSFKSKNVGYGIPQGVDYSAISGAGFDENKKAKIQKRIKNGENVASARQDLVVADIPRTLDYVKAYCPECNGFDGGDDLAQEALLALVESAKVNKARTVSGFESKADRLSKRRVKEAVQSQAQVRRSSCSLDEVADSIVTIEDCQRKNNDKRSQAFYDFIEGVLTPEEAAVIEGRHFCSKDQRKSFNDLANDLGVSVNKVRGIEGRALNKLRSPKNSRVLLEMAQDDSLNL